MQLWLLGISNTILIEFGREETTSRLSAYTVTLPLAYTTVYNITIGELNPHNGAILAVYDDGTNYVRTLTQFTIGSTYCPNAQSSATNRGGHWHTIGY